MKPARSLLLAGLVAASLFAHPAAAQSPPTAPGPAAAPPSRLYYSLFWGLFHSKNQPSRPALPVRVNAVVIQKISTGLPAPLPPGYRQRSILGGAVQWTEKTPPAKSPTAAP